MKLIYLKTLSGQVLQRVHLVIVEKRELSTSRTSRTSCRWVLLLYVDFTLRRFCEPTAVGVREDAVSYRVTTNPVLAASLHYYLHDLTSVWRRFFGFSMTYNFVATSGEAERNSQVAFLPSSRRLRRAAVHSKTLEVSSPARTCKMLQQLTW